MVMLERIHRHRQEGQRYNSVRREVGPDAGGGVFTAKLGDFARNFGVACPL
jgi:hypothetical protein